ncbi:PDZ domain-containing protein [Halobacteriaceae archaeon GCM10025711]
MTGIPVGGDVIVAVDGTPTPSQDALAQYLFRETRPGETVTLTVVRGGERLRIAVELGQRSLPRERTPSI